MTPPELLALIVVGGALAIVVIWIALTVLVGAIPFLVRLQGRALSLLPIRTAVAVTRPGWRSAVVERIIDGDTIVTKEDGEPVHIRVRWVECPKRHSDKGRRATAITTAFCPPGSRVYLKFHEYNRYANGRDRQVCTVVVGALRLDVLLRLVLAGVWWDGKGGSPLRNSWWRRQVFGDAG